VNNSNYTLEFISNVTGNNKHIQLDATEAFIADLIACSTYFGHHYAHHQELKSIIQWLLPVVFCAVFFKLLVWCGAEAYVSGLQDAVVHVEQTIRSAKKPETCSASNKFFKKTRIVLSKQ
jgi:hypothetical protein